MKKHSIVVAIILAFTLNSCTHYYYIPNVQNVPLLREKKEFHGTLAVGGGQEISTVEVQAAYAITDNLALMTNFAGAKGGEKSNNNWGKGKYIEGAVGYYRPLDEFVVAEVYAGLGVSNQHHQYGTAEYNNGTADLSFVKYFLQPSVGLTFKAFEIAVSTRFSRLSFLNVDNRITMDNPELHYVDALAQNKVSYLFEPALTIRGGCENIKLQLQLSSTKNLTHPNLQFEKSNISLGVFFTFPIKGRITTPDN